MRSKFKIADKVVVNKTCPKYIREPLRMNRVRTIVAIFYDPSTQHNRYYLGTNYRGEAIEDYHFRGSQLERVVKRGIGRPRLQVINRGEKRWGLYQPLRMGVFP